MNNLVHTKKMSMKEKLLNEIKHFIQPASKGLIRCVDERQALDAHNGIEVPGGIYGVVDAYKAITGADEEKAWQVVLRSGVPIGAHIDAHHGALGCGYARLVQTTPKSVLAPEAVTAESRLARVQAAQGTVMHYEGDHRPTTAIINDKDGYSFDPDQALKNGLGVFNLDRWALPQIGEKLGIDPQVFTDHVEKAFRKTVTELTGIQDFLQLK